MPQDKIKNYFKNSCFNLIIQWSQLSAKNWPAEEWISAKKADNRED